METEVTKKLTIILSEEETQMLSAIVKHSKVSLVKIRKDFPTDYNIDFGIGESFSWNKILDFADEVIEKCENI